jgi:hypothetical protein
VRAKDGVIVAAFRFLYIEKKYGNAAECGLLKKKGYTISYSQQDFETRLTSFYSKFDVDYT